MKKIAVIKPINSIEPILIFSKSKVKYPTNNFFKALIKFGKTFLSAKK